MCQCKKSDKYEVWMLYTDVIYSYMLYRFYILHQWSLISTINEEPLQSQFTPYFEKGYYIEKNSENDDVYSASDVVVEQCHVLAFQALENGDGFEDSSWRTKQETEYTAYLTLYTIVIQYNYCLF